MWGYMFQGNYRSTVYPVYWFHIYGIFHMCLTLGLSFVCVRFSLYFLLSVNRVVSNMCWASLELCPLFLMSLMCFFNLILNVRPVCPLISVDSLCIAIDILHLDCIYRCGFLSFGIMFYVVFSSVRYYYFFLLLWFLVRKMWRWPCKTSRLVFSVCYNLCYPFPGSGF
jgi:hypothetical protein